MDRLFAYSHYRLLADISWAKSAGESLLKIKVAQ